MRISDWSSDVCSSDLAFRVAQHPGEQLFAPYSHARSRGGKQRLPRKEEAGVHHLELRTADIIAGERRRPLGVLHEAIAQDHAVEAASTEERRVGKECVSTCRSRWSPYP